MNVEKVNFRRQSEEQTDLEDFTGGSSEMRVHPAAENFPLFSGEDLQSLADSIKKNGLRNPIVVSRDGVLIDGRNRLAACRLAGVEPRFDAYSGPDDDDEVRAFILDQNVERRSFTPGQKAMAAALTFPEARRGRGNRDAATPEEKGAGPAPFSVRRLKQARFILRYGGEALARSVTQGASFEAALEKAHKEKDEAESETGRLNRLRNEAPDLAEQVESDSLKLSEAWAAFIARLDAQKKHEELRRQQRATATLNLAKVLMHLVPSGSKKEPKRIDDRISEWMSEIDLDQWPREIAVTPDVETLRLAIRSLQQVLAHFNDGVIDG